MRFLRKHFPLSSELQRFSRKRGPLGCNIGCNLVKVLIDLQIVKSHINLPKIVQRIYLSRLYLVRYGAQNFLS